MEWRRRVLSFFAFRLKDSVFLSLEKQCFVLTVLSEAIAIKAKKSSKTDIEWYFLFPTQNTLTVVVKKVFACHIPE